MSMLLNSKSVRHHRVERFLIAALLIGATMGCQRHGAYFKLNGQAQGTYYCVQYYDRQQRDLQLQVDSLLDAFDLSASLWVDSSLLRKVNANLTDSLDPVLDSLLRYSLYIYDYTGGAFDCRVGRIVQAWGFSFRQRQEPDAETLAALLAAARADVSVADGRIVKADPATELDFNAIAQGYAVDLLAAMLDSLGIDNYLIDVGGEVIAHGVKADGRPWLVGIEQPATDSLSAPVVHTAIALRDCSVVTSGNYRKYYERDGMRYSHTIDPATGRPVEHTLLSASVIEKQSWLADAMATAYMVMGLDKAKAFIAAHPGGPGTTAVMLIYDDHGTLATYTTPAFDELTLLGTR